MSCSSDRHASTPGSGSDRGVRKVTPHLYQHVDGPHWSFSGADGTKVLLMMLYPMASSVGQQNWPSPMMTL